VEVRRDRRSMTLTMFASMLDISAQVT